MTSPSTSSSTISTPSLSAEDIDVDVEGAKQEPAPVPRAIELGDSTMKQKAVPLSQKTDQLRIDFCLLRIAALTILVLALIAAVLALTMGDGIRLHHYSTKDDTSTHEKDYLKKYKANVGTLMTGLNKAVDFILQILVAIACLCLFARWSTDREANPLMIHAPKLAIAGIGFLLSNGPTSINVEVVTGELHMRITTEDLLRRVDSIAQPIMAGTQSQLKSPWSKSFSETAAENPVLNTVLQTHFLPFQGVTTRCSGEDLKDTTYAYPTVAVTTPSEDWVLSALPVAIAPETSYNVYPLDKERLPTVEPKKARTLFALALIGLTTGENAMAPGQEFNMMTGINTSMVANSPDCVMTKESTYGTMLDCTPDDRLMEVISQALESILQSVLSSSLAVYSTHRLADAVTFTSLTLSYSIELTENPVSIDQRGCSEEGCSLIDGEEAFTAGDPMVGIARLGNGSKTADDSSGGPIVVLSIGKRLEGDTFDIDEATKNVTLGGVRMRYSLTVGLLEWKLDQLDTLLGAECISTDGCEGLRVANAFLTELNRVALVGRLGLQFSDLTNVAKSLEMLIVQPQTNVFNKPPNIPWTRLVSVSSTVKLQIALPRNFITVGEGVSAYLASRSSSTCPTAIDRHIKGVESNHLYIEDSLQTGYTAAFHYLVQNAVQHTYSPDKNTLDFSGNYQDLLVMASMPLRNAILSLTGCAVLIGMCLAIAVAHKRGKRIIEANSSAAMIAQSMLNESKYPRAVLSLWLERAMADAAAPSRRVNLDNVVLERADFSDRLKIQARKSVSTTV